MSHLPRREFLKAGAAGLAALGLSHQAFADDTNPYAPLNMGIQSYSLRSTKNLDDVLAKIKSLGLKNVEFYSAHMTPTTDAKKLAEYKEKLAAAGIRFMAYGVHGFGENVAENRKVFEFAKEMGIYTISASFKPKGALSLDKLCDEFPEIHVGIHNHGPNDTYSKPETVLDCIKDRHKNIGATADLGHYIRSKQDPLECLEKLKDRLFGVHFKDFANDGKEKIVGDANLKVKETLAFLKKNEFKGCISLEYELDGPKLMDDLKVALDRVQTAMKEI